MALTTVGFLLLLVLADCSWADEKEPSVSELLWKANKDVGCTEGEPLAMGDIAYQSRPYLMPDQCNFSTCLWPKSADGKVYVPYVIARNYSFRERSIIEQGLQSFSDVTCIRFVCRRKQRDYLNIQPGKGCYSYVGRQGNSQTISLNRLNCISLGMVQHEVLHALGFSHEQCRSDRNEHIRIFWQNILPDFHYTYNWYNTSNHGTPYDYNSIMQYHRYAYSVDPSKLPTMEAIDDPNLDFGRATKMSENDIIRVNRRYC